MSRIRFMLELDNLVNKVIDDKKENAIALISSNIDKDQLQRLADAGIRFIPIGFTDLLSIKDIKEDGKRWRFQEDTYTMMMLFSLIGKDNIIEDSVRSSLSYYLKSHFNLPPGATPAAAVDDYIEAIKRCDVAELIKGFISRRQFEKYDAVKEHQDISYSLIFA